MRGLKIQALAFRFPDSDPLLEWERALFRHPPPAEGVSNVVLPNQQVFGVRTLNRMTSLEGVSSTRRNPSRR